MSSILVDPHTLKVDYPSLPDLATGRIPLFATDDFFSPSVNLFLPTQPVFDPDAYTPWGKEMDGWETRRKRIAGHDFLIVALTPGVVRGVGVSTRWFTGNNAPRISIQAFNGDASVLAKLPSYTPTIGTAASPSDVASVDALTSKWTTILPMKPLNPGVEATHLHHFAVDSDQQWTHLRVNIFPDGGVARLRVFGEVAFAGLKSGSSEPIDLAAIENGGLAMSHTNAHYGTPLRLLAPGRSLGMHDGWETARNPTRPPIYSLLPSGLLDTTASESCVIRILPGSISSVLIDTRWYIGNYPESVGVEYWSGGKWKVLVKRQRVGPDAEHVIVPETNTNVNFVKVTMTPDGGISRVRLFGTPSKKRSR